MTPKQKAIDLLDKYRSLPICGMGWEEAKQCALIAVDEILTETPEIVYGTFQDAPHQSIAVNNPRLIYWQQVKTEIEKL